MGKITKEMEDNAELLNELIKLRENKSASKVDEIKYDRCFQKALDKFSYIVAIHTNRYKKYSNYEDLYQEGMMALMLALNKFNPVRSKNFFRIANWYIKTKIRRSANKYNIINVPMKDAKENALNRVDDFPIVKDTAFDSCELMEKEQIVKNIKEALKCLNALQKTIICSYYGIDQDGTNHENLSIASIAKQMNLPRVNVEKILNEAHIALVLKSDILSFDL